MTRTRGTILGGMLLVIGVVVAAAPASGAEMNACAEHAEPRLSPPPTAWVTPARISSDCRLPSSLDAAFDRGVQMEHNRALLSHLSTETPAPATDLAAAASGWQASTLGGTLGITSRPSTGEELADTVDRIATSAGLAPPSGGDDRLGEIGGPVATALQDLLLAHEAYQHAAAVVLEPGATPSSVGALLAARTELLHRTVAFDQAWSTTQGGSLVVDAPPAIRLDLRNACPDETYTEDYLLQIDACGDDTYENNAGGSGVGLRAPTGPLDASHPCLPEASPPVVGEDWLGYGTAAAAIDLAGDDAYASGRSCGVNGGGYLGAGFLYDGRGDDTYEGWNHAVNGGGRQGVGFLLDEAGNDTYVAGASGINGGGFIAGVGALVDLGGHDRYEATREHLVYGYGANGAGALGGTGFLYDAGGDDSYLGGQEGVNGGGYGLGVGFLYDADGDDVYEATYLGVNGEGRQGVGTLYDASGHDWYASTGTYSDHTGWDVTIVPKNTDILGIPSIFGAQIDDDR